MQFRQILLSALALALPTLATAAVVTNDSGLPPVPGYPASPAGKSTAPTTSSKSRVVVPGIHPSSAALARQNAHKVWQQAIATPPEGKESPVTAVLAQQALAASQQADGTPPVVGDADGAVTSVGGRPVLVCSPLHTCVIALPVGTKPVTTVGVSSTEWLVQQAMVGKQPEIFLTPKFAGLHQNIVVAAATESGAAINYQVRLVSDKNHYVPILKVAATPGQDRSWSQTEIDRLKAGQEITNKSDSMIRPVLPLPLVPVGTIHTNWTIHCGGGGWFSSSDCGAIRPLRAYDDGTHTFIQMPAGLASHGGFPIVQAFNRTGKKIGMNTQIRGHLIVLDSVPHQVRLRLGHEVVDIERGS